MGTRTATAEQVVEPASELSRTRQEQITRIYCEKFRTRFWSYVRIGALDECWPWQAGWNKKGYGQIGIYLGPDPDRPGAHRSVPMGAHVAAWMLTHGPILDPALQVCHECDNPPCCNPFNPARCLTLGTHAYNMLGRSERHGDGAFLRSSRAAAIRAAYRYALAHPLDRLMTALGLRAVGVEVVPHPTYDWLAEQFQTDVRHVQLALGPMGVGSTSRIGNLKPSAPDVLQSEAA